MCKKKDINGHDIRRLCVEFYLWMKNNDFDHNLKIRVENKAEIFLREKNIR